MQLQRAIIKKKFTKMSNFFVLVYSNKSYFIFTIIKDFLHTHTHTHIHIYMYTYKLFTLKHLIALCLFELIKRNAKRLMHVSGLIECQR